MSAVLGPDLCIVPTKFQLGTITGEAMTLLSKDVIPNPVITADNTNV